MKSKCIYLLFSFLFLFTAQPSAAGVYEPHFSTAGFYALPGTGREVRSMNPAWRFHKGAAAGAERPDYDDSAWEYVSLPHGLELLPSEASGCINYQGEAWYRKRFTLPQDLRGKRLFLHFEAIMGRSKVWVNGRLLTEHFGGYLPVVVDVTPYVRPEGDNVVAVMTDNSDNPLYPPGKPQDALDFTYAGGIYRDCWLVAHGNVFITDPNYEDVAAGGGLFVAFSDVSERSAKVHLRTHVRNAGSGKFRGSVEYRLVDADGRLVKKAEKSLSVPEAEAATAQSTVSVQRPHLWSPDAPYLYRLEVRVKDRRGRTVDGYSRRIGIRSFEFRGKDGFWLNGRPYGEPLIGANRHQDFAVVGNALSNSLHWRDAKKLRDAGLRVVRNAHYPQDPAFMDACDELGLLVIVNTPGWQFWNKAPEFGRRVYQDIRNMVRRDRNHPSVWLWEPILNETSYPDDFAKKAKETVEEEYPFPYCYTACDVIARGSEYYPVRFMHPLNGTDVTLKKDEIDPKISYFTREWGDNVDNWNSHNSPSRVSRAWGEVPMLVQAQGYARPSYQYTCYDAFYRVPAQHVGGCLWHSFDHQRGYHPDPFYGGLMDAFRQPKYSYYMFCAQRPPRRDTTLIAETGPMVYVANAMTPFSPSDVTVYSNCDEVRLTYCQGGKTYTYRKDTAAAGMPSPVITFRDVFHVMDDKALSRARRIEESYLLAEGLMDGKVVATHKVQPARRPTRLLLWADNEGTPLRADGSDLVTVVAAVADDAGRIKRLNNQFVRFEVEGPGELVADSRSQTNPRRVEWGTAPCLVRATTQPGTIRVRAYVTWQGKYTPAPAVLDIPVAAPDVPLLLDKDEEQALQDEVGRRNGGQLSAATYATAEKATPRAGADQKHLREVEQQQTAFE